MHQLSYRWTYQSGAGRTGGPVYDNVGNVSFPAVGSSGPPHHAYPQLPTIPYGAVYFRKTNPPKEDWDRDYQQAAADGMNSFRHWFMWSAVEVAQGICN